MQITKEYLTELVANLEQQRRNALDTAAGAMGAIQALQHLIEKADAPEPVPAAKD